MYLIDLLIYHEKSVAEQNKHEQSVSIPRREPVIKNVRKLFWFYTQFKYRSWDNISWSKIFEIPYSLAISRTVSRRSLSSTSRSSFFAALQSRKDGLPSRRSSQKLSLPSKNLLYRLNTNERPTLHCFPDCLQNSWVYLGVFPISTQNFIAALCSTFSENVIFFNNVKTV